ncbi:MAG: hypothetical protein FWE37_05105 [Spirochaetaceae bacterium]|nr:hypothetical protein [Spirochaetaceae bacterium]
MARKIPIDQLVSTLSFNVDRRRMGPQLNRLSRDMAQIPSLSGRGMNNFFRNSDRGFKKLNQQITKVSRSLKQLGTGNAFAGGLAGGMAGGAIGMLVGGIQNAATAFLRAADAGVQARDQVISNRTIGRAFGLGEAEGSAIQQALATQGLQAGELINVARTARDNAFTGDNQWVNAAGVTQLDTADTALRKIFEYLDTIDNPAMRRQVAASLGFGQDFMDSEFGRIGGWRRYIEEYQRALQYQPSNLSSQDLAGSNQYAAERAGLEAERAQVEVRYLQNESARNAAVNTIKAQNYLREKELQMLTLIAERVDGVAKDNTLKNFLGGIGDAIKGFLSNPVGSIAPGLTKEAATREQAQRAAVAEMERIYGKNDQRVLDFIALQGMAGGRGGMGTREHQAGYRERLDELTRKYGGEWTEE